MSVVSSLEKAYGSRFQGYNPYNLAWITTKDPGVPMSDVYIRKAHVDENSITDHLDPQIDFKLGYRHDIKNQKHAPKYVSIRKNDKLKPKVFHTDLSGFNQILAASNKPMLNGWELTRQATNPQYYGNSAQSRKLLNIRAPIVSAKDNAAFRGWIDKQPTSSHTVEPSLHSNVVMQSKKPFDYSKERQYQLGREQQTNWDKSNSKDINYLANNSKRHFRNEMNKNVGEFSRFDPSEYTPDQRLLVKNDGPDL